MYDILMMARRASMPAFFHARMPRCCARAMRAAADAASSAAARQRPHDIAADAGGNAATLRGRVVAEERYVHATRVASQPRRVTQRDYALR